MVRSFAVFGMAFTGVFMLAGAGWALLAGAVLVCVLWRREPEWRPVAARWLAWVKTARARLAAAPRRAVAAGGMTSAVVIGPAGFGLALGAGAALIALGAALAGVALLTGWNT